MNSLFRQCENFFLSYSQSDNGKFIRALRDVLGYTPIDTPLYKTAFTHSSVGGGHKVRSRKPVEHNERLEFLGDAVIGAVVSEYLYSKFPNQREGFLTQLRSKIVGRTALGRLAWELGLVKFVRSHLNNKQPLSRNVLGNTLEAMVGAIYIDKGYARAKKVFLNRFFLPHVNVDELNSHEFDYKSRLLEVVQKRGYSASFDTSEGVAGTGKNKGMLTFSSTLLVNDRLMGSGTGHSKKEAEQHAAEQAYNKFVARGE